MRKVLLYLFLACLLAAGTAADAEEGQRHSFEGIEFLSGLGRARLSEEPDYRLIPLFAGFNYDFKKLTRRFNFNPLQLLQFQLEPFLSAAVSPDANIEVGGAFLFKVGILPERSRFQPYVKAGAGVIYLTQHAKEQSTQCNFIEYAGAGINYFFKPDTAFTLEYRYRHLSNASIRRPNGGIDTHFILTGISYKF